MLPTDLLAKTAAIGTVSALGSMYLNARFHIGTDLAVLQNGLKTRKRFNQIVKQSRLNAYYLFRDRAKSTPNRTYIIFEGQEYTYQEIEKASNRLANWLLQQNVKQKDRICMMHQNHPTFIIAWLAITKIGAIAAFINNNLSGESLLHCLRLIHPKMVLFDPKYQQQLDTLRADIDSSVLLYAYGEETDNTDHGSDVSLTRQVLQNYSDDDVSEDYIKHTTTSDFAMFVYTSGTTGMPKASGVLHSRAICSSLNVFIGLNYQPDDRVYAVLPLYHSSASFMGMLAPLYNGSTLVLGRKFSAKHFWDDIATYKVTIFIYIGELCRYLLAQPVHPQERNHKVRLICGNGMRSDVWNRFRDRFNIQRIVEFYGSTEAPLGIYVDNRNEYGSGATGRYGPLIRAFLPHFKFVKIDPVSEKPLLDKDGFLVQCKPNEPGELLILLEHDPSSAVKFGGYYDNQDATKSKILTNVFRKGDRYFCTGDLLLLTDDGFVYFVDRIGDTFRWKSENVSTTEVANALGTFPGVLDVNVYGTLVPGHEGRASMAAIRVFDHFDFHGLANHLKLKLPSYAVPLFLRVVNSMETTGTFKQPKVEFRNQGIQLHLIPNHESVYWLQNGTFVPFREKDLDAIKAGKAKL